MSANTWLMVAMGGALGASTRFGASLILPVGHVFPWATLSVNLLGCFAIGFLFQMGLGKDLGLWMPFLMVGFLGGFTTFSSFGLEVFKLFNNKQFTYLVVYVLISNIIGFVAVFGGMKSYKLWFNAPVVL